MPNEFTWAMEIGLLPTVEDVVGKEVHKKILQQLQKSEISNMQTDFERCSVQSSKMVLLDGFLSMGQVQTISEQFADERIHTTRIKNRTAYRNSNGFCNSISAANLSK